PGTPLKRIPRPADAGAPASSSTPPAAHASAPSATPGVTLEAVLGEVRAVRRLQEEALNLLRKATASESASGPGDDSFTALDQPMAQPPPPAVRSPKRKSVLLIDDDEKTRKAAHDAFERAQVPVRLASAGNAGLAS